MGTIYIYVYFFGDGCNSVDNKRVSCIMYTHNYVILCGQGRLRLTVWKCITIMRFPLIIIKIIIHYHLDKIVVNNINNNNDETKSIL
jgi:hypothetical protein